MAKVSLNNIGSAYGSIGALNANFDAVEVAFENTLSRDGSGPNQMEANLDMNNNSILNADTVYADALVLQGIPVPPFGDVVNIGSEIVNAKSFGAVGDGVTNDSAALQSAIDAAYGQRLHIPEGRYLIPDGLVITDRIHIMMDPGTILDYSTAAAGIDLNDKKAIEIQGQLSTEVDITANVTKNATTISVSSNSPFNAENYVVVKSSEVFMTGVTGAGAVITRGHIAQVASKATGTVTLVEGSPFTYATASNAKMVKLLPVFNVTIEGGAILGGGVNKAHTGIYAYCTSGLRIRNVRIDDCEDVGISVWYSADCSISGCRISDATSPFTLLGKNTGYGVSFYAGTRDSTVEDSWFYNCRHSVTGGSTPLPMYINVKNTRSYNCGINTLALDCHEPCFWWTFEDNLVEGGFGGIVARGQYTKIINNHFSNCLSDGVRIRSYYDNTDGLNGIIIANNTVENCGSYGIFFDNTQSPLKDITVSGNSILNSQFAAIGGCGVNGITIDGNVLSGVKSSSGSEGNIIRFFGKSVTIGTSSARGDSSRIVISNNIVTNPLRNGMLIEYATDVSLDNNIVHGVPDTRNCVNLFDCENVNVTGGVLDSSVTGFYGLSVDTCDNVNISGVRLKGRNGPSGMAGVRVFRTSGTGTNNRITFNDNIATDYTRWAFYATNSDYIIATGNNVAAVNEPAGSEIKADNATNIVIQNNIFKKNNNWWGEPVSVASNITLSRNTTYDVNTTSSALTLNMPYPYTAGDWVIIRDVALTFGTNNVTLDPQAGEFYDATQNYVMDVTGEERKFVVHSTRGWIRG